MHHCDDTMFLHWSQCDNVPSYHRCGHNTGFISWLRGKLASGWAYFLVVRANVGKVQVRLSHELVIPWFHGIRTQGKLGIWGCETSRKGQVGSTVVAHVVDELLVL